MWDGDRCETCGSRADLAQVGTLGVSPTGLVSAVRITCAACENAALRRDGLLPPGAADRRPVQRIVFAVGFGWRFEYREHTLTRARSCDQCRRPIPRRAYAYRRRRQSAACLPCGARTRWAGRPQTRAVGVARVHCRRCAREIDRYQNFYEGIALGHTICGDCLDLRLEQHLARDNRTAFNL